MRCCLVLSATFQGKGYHQETPRVRRTLPEIVSFVVAEVGWALQLSPVDLCSSGPVKCTYCVPREGAAVRVPCISMARTVLDPVTGRGGPPVESEVLCKAISLLRVWLAFGQRPCLPKGPALPSCRGQWLEVRNLVQGIAPT